jgi:hypothetical protein
MSNLKLEIGFGDYDRTKVMVDGSVKIDGVDANYHSYRIVTEVFEAMVRERAFHVAELGMSYFLRTMDFDDPPFLGYQYFRTVVPAFGNLYQCQQRYQKTRRPRWQNRGCVRDVRS